MPEAILTIKNYRCFEDTKPLVIELGKGFTALVGRNNSGKSSFLKFFFELRNVWQNLQHASNFVQITHGNPISISPIGIYDPQEIFTDTNNRPLSIDIEIHPNFC